jgi:hypothetical protein
MGLAGKKQDRNDYIFPAIFQEKYSDNINEGKEFIISRIDKPSSQ